MALSADFSGVGNAENIQDGKESPKPGHGMMVITKWSEYTGPNSAHEMTLEIVAWTDSDSVGMEYEEKVWTIDNSGKGHPAKVLCAIGLAAGLFTPADVAEWQKRGAPASIDYTKIVNRPVMVSLVEEPDKNDKDKKWVRIGNVGKSLYHVADPRVAEWPKHAGILQKTAAIVGGWEPDKLRASLESETSSEDSPF